MRCDELKDLMPLRAADLLDAREEASLREHLDAGCPNCTAEMAAAREVVDSLPFALPEEDPSPMARARLMAAVAKEGDPGAARRVEPPSSFWSTWQGTAVAALAASLLVGVVTAYVMLQLQKDLIRGHEAETARLLDEMDRQREEMVSLTRRVREATESIQLASAPGVTVVDLEGQGPQAASAARIFWDRRRAAWQLYAADLPAAPAGKTYQLWLITASAKISAGTFDAPREGEVAPASGSVTIPPDASPVLAAAVTDEPAGGSPQPTGSILLLGKI